MRLIPAVICIAAAAILGISRQTVDRMAASAVTAAEWDVKDWASIRLGRLGLVHQSGGDRLEVYALSATEPQAASGNIRSSTPACNGNCLPVSSPDEGVRNRLGGYFSAFQSPPSAARAALADEDDGRRALTLDFTRAGSGYCGMWIHLFDSRLPLSERVYLDASPFSFLTFWIRGRTGDERLLLKISDADWERKEDAVPVGDVGSYLPNGRIDSIWRQAVIPLRALPQNLDRRRLAALVFEAAGGEGRVAVKDVGFCIRREALPPLSPTARLPVAGGGSEKALWVWNTATILPSASEQTALVEFCSRQGITHVFLQLPKDKEQLGPAGEIVLQPDRWKPFLALLNRNGMKPYALDGFKDYALPEWRQRVLMSVENIVRFNESAGAGERFAGVHYDIEPYLLAGFQGRARQRLLTGYLELLEGMASRIRISGMTFGADIPFWYDTPDELTGQTYPIEFHGRRKPASEHVIDLVDIVVVMDYRTSAYGANGILALSEGELDYAAKAGKKLFVGLETTDLPDEDVIDFGGKPGLGLPGQAPAERRIFIAPDPAGARIWLVSPSQWGEFLEDIRARGTARDSLVWWPVRRISPVPASRLTFSSLGAAPLRQTMLEAQRELSRHPAFAGFAIHDYRGYRTLLEKFSPNGR